MSEIRRIDERVPPVGPGRPVRSGTEERPRKRPPPPEPPPEEKDEWPEPPDGRLDVVV
jgi:hypothetical protein